MSGWALQGRGAKRMIGRQDDGFALDRPPGVFVGRGGTGRSLTAVPQHVEPRILEQRRQVGHFSTGHSG
ncbi:MAG: hypothetical protein HON53_21440 [Planctomycetaceae bacterium]|nr:hypothetical protein [Planctomycetaceae bacterium]MBT6156571.1 hypothetical protein [Planctomycetaceae bacterium]MBT6496706.1 hypothetical protein [Planctomycetaceae bacterium]